MTEKERLEKAKMLYKTANVNQRYVLESFFPELKESEDERIRTELINGFKECLKNSQYPKNAQKYWHNIKIEDILAWIEKQGEQKSTLPKWKYKKDHTPLLRDSIILNKYGGVAKSPSGAIVSDVWVLDYGELVKLPKEEIEKQCEQKLSDKVKPMFNVGEWVTNSIDTVQITGYDIDYGYQVNYKGNLQHRDTDIIEKEYHLWTIQDAKDGDVLVASDDSLFIFAKLKDNSAYYHFSLCKNGSKEISDGNHSWETANSCHPATKEQCEQLFKAMHEAGYEWVAEKKELKKIEEEINGEDYGIDSLYHAQRILEKTLGKVDGYQSDDGILEHKCAISAVKKLYEQKSAWSEEDECYMTECIGAIATKDGWSFEEKRRTKHWLKSLKQRMEEQ